jgi:hypothetical protein
MLNHPDKGASQGPRKNNTTRRSLGFAVAAFITLALPLLVGAQTAITTPSGDTLMVYTEKQD